MSDATAKELEDMEVQVCAFCFKENPPGEDKGTFEWIECDRSPSNGASISHTSPWSQPFPE